MNHNYWAGLLLVVFLTGCIPTVCPVVLHEPQLVVCQSAPPVDKLSLRKTDPTVLVVEGLPYFTFTPEGYTALGKNLQDILSVLRQEKRLVGYYEECIESHNITQNTLHKNASHQK